MKLKWNAFQTKNNQETDEISLALALLAAFGMAVAVAFPEHVGAIAREVPCFVAQVAALPARGSSAFRLLALSALCLLALALAFASFSSFWRALLARRTSQDSFPEKNIKLQTAPKTSLDPLAPVVA